MKHFIQSALLLLALLQPVAAMAQDFEADGIYYDIHGNEVTVTRYQFGNPYVHAYEGDVVIPPTVTYNGTTYTVTASARTRLATVTV